MTHCDFLGRELKKDDLVVVQGYNNYEIFKIIHLSDKMVKGSRIWRRPIRKAKAKYIYPHLCLKVSPEEVTYRLLKK